MKKIFFLILLASCTKSNFTVSTWEVWRGSDTVKEANHAYFCTGHQEGIKTLSIDPSREHSYYMAIDSIVIIQVKDSFERHYIQWRKKIN
jgi:hypothetical protein